MKKKILHLVLGGWLNIVLNAILGIYIARVLGPEDKGVLALALGSVAVLSMLLSFGAPHAAGYFIRSKPGSTKKILLFINLTMVVCVLTAGLLLLVGAARFSQIFLDGRPMSLLFMALLVLATVVGAANSILLSSIIALGDAKTGALSMNIATVSAAIFTFFFLSYTSMRVDGVVIGTLLGQSLGTLLLQLKIRHHANGETPYDLTFREFLAYGMKVQVGSLASLAFKRADLFVVGYFLNPAAVGLYSIGLSLRDMALVVCRSTTGLIAGELARPESRSDGSGTRLLTRSLWFNLAFSLIASTSAFLLFPLLIPLVYSSKYLGAVSPSILIMFSSVPLSLAILIAAATNSYGRPFSASIGNLAAAFLGAALIWELTRHFGLSGAGWSAILASFVLLTLQGGIFLIATRYQHGPKTDKLAGKRLLFALQSPIRNIFRKWPG